MFVFRKIWRTLLSCYLRFEIHPFALLQTNFRITFIVRPLVVFMTPNLSLYLSLGYYKLFGITPWFYLIANWKILQYSNENSSDGVIF